MVSANRVRNLARRTSQFARMGHHASIDKQLEIFLENFLSSFLLLFPPPLSFSSFLLLFSPPLFFSSFRNCSKMRTGCDGYMGHHASIEPNIESERLRAWGEVAAKQYCFSLSTNY
jgi:hypothetical protein